MTVITISRQYGSGGNEIAERVCKILGYRKFDKHMIEMAAVDAGLSEQEAVDFPEENFKVRSFQERLFGGIPLPERVRRLGKAAPTREEPALSETAKQTLVQRSIQNACKAGNLVIVGRGGQALLRDCEGVLHIRIEAPLEDRIQRLKGHIKEERQDYSADIESRRTTQDLIQQHDDSSEAYVREVYGIDWNDPDNYHLVINTSKLSPEMSAQIIATLARQFEDLPDPSLPTAEH